MIIFFTKIDVYTKQMYQSLNSISAQTIAKYLVQWFSRHSNIQFLKIIAQGSHFVSKLLHALAKVLEIKLEHSTVKHTQTIGVVVRSHEPLTRFLKIYENQL